MPRKKNEKLVLVLDELLQTQELPALHRKVFLAIRNVENKRAERALGNNVGLLALAWEDVYESVADFLGLGSEYLNAPLKVVRKIEKQIGKVIATLNPFSRKGPDARRDYIEDKAVKAAPIAVILAVIGALFLLLDAIEYGSKIMKWASRWYNAIKLNVTKGAVSKMMRDIANTETDLQALELIDKMKDDPASQRAFFLLYGDQPTVKSLVEKNPDFGDAKITDAEFTMQTTPVQEQSNQESDMTTKPQKPSKSEEAVLAEFEQALEALPGQKVARYNSRAVGYLSGVPRGKVKVTIRIAKLIFKAVKAGSGSVKRIFSTLAKSKSAPAAVAKAASGVVSLFNTKVGMSFAAWAARNPKIWSFAKTLGTWVGIDLVITSTVKVLEFVGVMDDDLEDALDEALDALASYNEDGLGDKVVDFLMQLASTDEDGNDTILTIENVSDEAAALLVPAGQMKRTRSTGPRRARVVDADWLNDLLNAVGTAPGVTIPPGMTNITSNAVTAQGTEVGQITESLSAQLGLSGRDEDHLRAMLMRSAVSLVRGVPVYDLASQLSHSYDISLADAIATLESIDLTNTTVLNAAMYINAPFSYRY
jgi:hypothetical protein